MKKVVLLPLMSLALAACDNDAEKQRQMDMQRQQMLTQQYAPQPYAQPQYAQPPVVQQPVIQPQVVQAPAQPVIVQQQHDNTLTNMALGAVIGHTIANMGSNDNHTTERVVEHKTVIIDNRQPQSAPSPQVSNVAPTTVTPPIAPVPNQPKPSAMDMNKLSASAKQSFNTDTPTPVVSAPKSSGMDMSKLSSKPSVNLSKPASSMNMSKLSRK